jgi:hypothetical protein
MYDIWRPPFDELDCSVPDASAPTSAELNRVMMDSHYSRIKLWAAAIAASGLLYVRMPRTGLEKAQLNMDRSSSHSRSIASTSTRSLASPAPNSQPSRTCIS